MFLPHYALIFLSHFCKVSWPIFSSYFLSPPLTTFVGKARLHIDTPWDRFPCTILASSGSRTGCSTSMKSYRGRPVSGCPRGPAALGISTNGASARANPTGLPHGGQMARRSREPGFFFQRPDRPKVLRGGLVGPCSNRYLAFCLRLDWPARSATRSMFGDFLTNDPGLSGPRTLCLQVLAPGLVSCFLFIYFIFHCRFADSGPLVLEGPPSGYLIPEARLVTLVTHSESPPASRADYPELWIHV